MRQSPRRVPNMDDVGAEGVPHSSMDVAKIVETTNERLVEQGRWRFPDGPVSVPTQKRKEPVSEQRWTFLDQLIGSLSFPSVGLLRVESLQRTPKMGEDQGKNDWEMSGMRHSKQIMPMNLGFFDFGTISARQNIMTTHPQDPTEHSNNGAVDECPGGRTSRPMQPGGGISSSIAEQHTE